MTRSIAEEAARIHLNLRSQGFAIDHRDIFIAATAKVHDLPIKTINTKDFSKVTGLKLA